MSGDVGTSSFGIQYSIFLIEKLKDLKIEKFGLEDAVLWEGLKVVRFGKRYQLCCGSRKSYFVNPKLKERGKLNNINK